MNKEMITTSPLYAHDMTGWCFEKINNTVMFLASQCDFLRQYESQKERIYLPLGETGYEIDPWDDLYSALWDSTKILAYFSGGKWSTSDAQTVMDNGIDGYEQILVRYGILEKTKREKALEEEHGKAATVAKKIANLHSGIIEYSRGLKSPNRTLLHELFRKNRCQNTPKEFLEIEDALEDVTMGKMEWSDFQRFVRERIDNYAASVESL